MVRTELFDYALPEQLIAQRPAEPRESARLLSVGGESCTHHRVADLVELIEPGSLVVVNQTRVRHARLSGRRAGSGGRVELLLLEKHRDGCWSALGRSSRRLKPGDRILVDWLQVDIEEKRDDGTLYVRLSNSASEEQDIASLGSVPLPPYIKRAADAVDRERYQTVYATELGSVAAPTAGLHFTRQMLRDFEARGVRIHSVTLHVGLGTFRPVSAADLDEHAMHEEHIRVGADVVRQVAAARREARPVVAIGTTVVRALETAADPGRPGHVRECERSTRLLIQPGYRFRVVDALLTNFHMPRSTLLALVSAFAGRERIMDAYQRAIDDRYRFLSYGDAMWIPRRYADDI